MDFASASDLPSWFFAALLFILVVYFGGTFHIVRLFVAHREAMAKWEPDRTVLTSAFEAMERRVLYFMNWPALITSIAMGCWAIWKTPGALLTGSIQALLGYASLLLFYQVMAHRIHRRASMGTMIWSTLRLRLFAHGVTVLAFGLIMILMMREDLGVLAGILGLLVVGGILFHLIASTGTSPKPTPDA